MRFISLSLIITALTTYSCSSNYHQPESIDSKMARYQAKKDNINDVPEIDVLTSAIRVSRGRGPASIKASSEERMMKTHSNKKLYFLTLYSQYKTIQSFVQEENAPEIQFCPNFHTALINHRDKYDGHQKTINYRFPLSDATSSLWDKDVVALYPELALPLAQEGQRPQVVDYLRREKSLVQAEELVQQGLKIHLLKTYKELRELCEYGNSDNYYKYENLVSFVQNSGALTPNADGLKILLKTTIFSNKALIQSLEKASGPSRGIASLGHKKIQAVKDLYMSEVTHRLQVPWAEEYFAQVHTLRK